MNVFILNTGRCGSATFIKACKHITNFSSAHESRWHQLRDARLDYPVNHIEADNRLSWFLGRLDRKYGDAAAYVHLKRNQNGTARSYAKRFHPRGIMPAYRKGILLQQLPEGTTDYDVALDYCDTVNSNIELFLKDKSKKMEFNIENAKDDYRRFWEFIGATGDIDAALSEFDKKYNASVEIVDSGKEQRPILLRVLKKLYRVVVKFLKYIKKALP